MVGDVVVVGDSGLVASYRVATAAGTELDRRDRRTPHNHGRGCAQRGVDQVQALARRQADPAHALARGEHAVEVPLDLEGPGHPRAGQPNLARLTQQIGERVWAANGHNW